MEHVYTLKHIGINHPNADAARETADRLNHIFNLPKGPDGDGPIFVGTIFECLKNDLRGAHGHLAVAVDDVEWAIQDLTSRGVEFLEEPILRDENGRIKFILLKESVAGFVIHLSKAD